MMKRGLSLICAIAMVFSLCMFYVGEADLTVMATEEAEADYLVTDAAGFKDAVANATSGQVIQLQNNIVFSANEYSYDKATGEITVTEGEAAVGTIAADGTVTGEVALHNEYFNLTLADGVTVDGNGYTISGLAYVGEGSSSVSLFTKLPANSKVVDINFDNCVIVNKGNGTASHAALIAYEIYGDVINVNATDITILGVITATGGYSWMGGFGVYAKTTKSTGRNVPTTLQGLYDIISGKDTNAKLLKTPTIANCRIDGNMVISYVGTEASTSAATMFGGIITRTYGVKMYNCVNSADVTVKGAKCGQFGGILGLGAVDGDSKYTIGAPSSITIYNCANYGNMAFTDGATMNSSNTGGIVGRLSLNDAFGADVSVVNCYNGSSSTGSQGLFGGVDKPGRIAAPSGNGIHYIEGIPWVAYGYGGSAVNYSKTTAVNQGLNVNNPVHSYGGTNEYGTANVYGTLSGNNSNGWVGSGQYGNINFAVGEAIGDDKEVTALYGTTNPTEILSITSKYLEGALPWVEGTDGYPTINFEATRSEAGSKADPVIIDNATELNELRDVYNALKNVGYSIEINAKLGADINLNEGVTFGYDSTNKAGTVTVNGTKYLVGAGIGNYAAGTFYDEVGTAVTAPSLNKWTPFESLITSDGKWSYYGKISFNLDGNGKRIDGLYVNAVKAGFVSQGANMVISNLTIDGLVVGSSYTGAFAGCANSRFTLNDCVNEATVIGSASTGGMVGRIGLQHSSTSLIDRLPNYVPAILGCANKGYVTAVNNAGGIAGELNTSGDVSYNTNMGAVYGDALTYNNDTGAVTGGKANAGGIIGYINLNAQAAAGTIFGYTSPSWGHVRPVQFVLHLIGNSNSGSVSTQYGTKVSEIVPTVHNAWASNGAMVVKEGEAFKVALILPSIIEAYGNVYKTTQSTATAVVGAFQTGTEQQTLIIGETDLKGPAKTSAYKAEIFIKADTSNAAGQITTLTNTSKTSQFNNKGYMMWLDHDYDNGLVPHAIKAQADVEYSGTTITVNDKAGLMLINKTINDVTVKEANGYADINAAASAATSTAIMHTNVKDYLQSVSGITIASDSKDDIGNALWLSQLKGFTVKLGKDIDLGGETWIPLGNAANAYASNANIRTVTGNSAMIHYGFRGTFDGNGKTVSNFKLRTDAHAAFFATVIDATIKNFTIDNLDVTSAYDLAVFALHSDKSTFDNCDIGKDVNVKASTLMASGVVLVSHGGTITNCENNAKKIYAQNQMNRSMGVAGIVGKNLYGTKVTNCTNNGAIEGVFNNGIGGIVGYAEHLASGSAYIRNCVNNAAITGWNTSISGGIIGNNAPWQANGQCYIEGNVNNGSVRADTNQAGGIVGALGGNATCTTNVRYNVNNGAVSSSSKAAGIAATTRAIDVVDANVNTGVVKLGGEDQTATYGITYDGNAVPTNSYSAGMNGTTADDIASGKVTALVNNAVGKVFSQNIGEEATPVPVALAKVVVYPEILTTVPATYEAGNGKAYVGYMDAAGTVYRPGATVDSVVGKPVTFTFYTAYGAGIRLGTPSGLRYTTFVNEAELATFGIEDTDFGTVIVPSSYVGTKGNNVQEIINSNCQKIDIANSGWYDKTDIAIPDGYKAYCGSVVNIKNQTMNFAGLSYVKITYADGEGYVTAPWQTAANAETTSVAYVEAANARSIAYVANAIKADEAVYNNYSDTVKALIDGWAAQYVA